MKQHIIECWEVYTSYDRVVNHVAYFGTEYLAAKYIENSKNKNYMNRHKVKKMYVIFDSLEEVEEYSKENLRRSGLAKLTDLEKQALGIKE